jgi:hypothetical protein
MPNMPDANEKPLSPVDALTLSLKNATVLSVLYLVAGTVVELARRVGNYRWADKLSLAFEAFPARTLDLVGLFQPMRTAWAADHLSGSQVRLIYGLTTVAIIFTIGTVVGVAMWGVAVLASRAPKT